MKRNGNTNRFTFTINGVEHSAGKECSSDVMLVDYLRDHLQLRGTKYMCREGGCGACIVTAAKSCDSPSMSVNSCLVSIGSCQDWNITTIEGLGNRKIGYHPLQTTLAKFNGSQCGHCTPGMVMAMHGFLETKKNPTDLEVEKSLASNVCRCTGYRPILDAFKKVASENIKIKDIEDLSICKKNRSISQNTCDNNDWCLLEHELYDDPIKMIELADGKKWYVPATLQDVFTIFAKEGTHSYMLVAGNTAKGAVPIDSYPNILIDVSKLNDLKEKSTDQNLIVGAGTTLTDFLDILMIESKTEYFGYLSKLYDHILLVAHPAVRNIGTLAGNLITKHNHPSFQSDIFLLFTTVGAQLTIMSSDDSHDMVTMEDFLKLDMKGKVIKNVLLPPLNNKHKLETFKVMPKAQNAHAIVNAGFLFELTQDNIVESARIVYGGLSDHFVRATKSEDSLIGQNLFTNETLQATLKVMDSELVVTPNPPEPSVEYRKYLAKGLFFKGLLTLCPDTIRNSKFDSGTIKLHDARPVSNGSQTYSTDPLLYPFNQPIVKLEATIQCAGEAKYTEDIPSFVNEVFGAFVLATVAVGTISGIDASAALSMEGVLAFYTAKHIPGERK